MPPPAIGPDRLRHPRPGGSGVLRLATCLFLLVSVGGFGRLFEIEIDARPETAPAVATHEQARGGCPAHARGFGPSPAIASVSSSPDPTARSRSIARTCHYRRGGSGGARAPTQLAR